MILTAVLFVLAAVFAASAVNGSKTAETESQTVSAAEETEGAQTSDSVSEQASSQESAGGTEAETEGETEADTSGTAVRETQTKQETTTKAAGTTARETQAQASGSITVTISVSCKNALAYGADVPQSGYIISKTQITLEEGQTVFDALEAVCDKNGVSLEYKSKAYIQGIGGLKEKDCGSASGWMYRVNGTAPAKAASKYTLSDGDDVEWYYVTSASDN